MINQLMDLFRYDPEAPMVFNSGLFLFLFPVFIVCYYWLRERRQWRMIYVIVFSYFFYYKSSGFYFLLLFFTSLFDYMLAALIAQSREKWKKRLYLGVSILANLGLLGYFKYTNLFREIWQDISGAEFLSVEIILPVGISFFTFQSLSYTIDIYRGQVAPLRRFMDYAFYVSFFPQLVAGPIVRARDFIPQMLANVKVTQEMFGRGIFLIMTGLFKKAVISDYISINFVDRIFDAPSLYSGIENLMAVYGYALQIYCDFSGYSDMAIGIALLLGFHFKMNFNSPYKSQSITEFWKRWHISLSTWLRDYLYIPLGGNRKGKGRTYANLLVTMLLGGLWHGASLRFVFWGGWHGMWLAVERWWKQRRQTVSVDGTIQKRRNREHYWERILSGVKVGLNKDRRGFSTMQMARRIFIPMGYLLVGVEKLVRYVWEVVTCIYRWGIKLGRQYPFARRLLKMAFTFHVVCFGWIFFRASTFSSAWEMIRQIVFVFKGNLFWQWMTGYSGVAVLMLLGYAMHFLPDRFENHACAWLICSSLVVKASVLAIVIFFVMQVKSSDILPFIYFQF